MAIPNWQSPFGQMYNVPRQQRYTPPGTQLSPDAPRRSQGRPYNPLSGNFSARGGGAGLGGGGNYVGSGSNGYRRGGTNGLPGPIFESGDNRLRAGINTGMDGLMHASNPLPPETPRPSGPAPPAPGGLIGQLPGLDRIPEQPRVDDTQAAHEAYARAKDVAGRQGRAAMDALMDVQGARGMVGSGLGVNEAGGIIQEGAAQLGDFNSQQLQMRVDNERRRQEMIYQGLINQRGQDINMRGQELERRRYNAGRLNPREYAY